MLVWYRTRSWTRYQSDTERRVGAGGWEKCDCVCVENSACEQHACCDALLACDQVLQPARVRPHHDDYQQRHHDGGGACIARPPASILQPTSPTRQGWEGVGSALQPNVVFTLSRHESVKSRLVVHECVLTPGGRGEPLCG